MVITKNPTLAPAHQKSTYETKAQEADGTVNAETMQDATAFLETFFKLYPTATEKELAYYVAGNVKLSLSVKFLDNQTKATQISQFELVLCKDGNWKIAG